MTLRITSTTNLDLATQEFRKAVRGAVDTALIELADHLQQNSPVGVSPVSESLRGRWDIIPARKRRGGLQVLGSVTNTADAAQYRIVGRGPGRVPPSGPDTPLGRWAAVKGIPAYLVARKIATEGTKRWRQGAQGNILKQDPRTGKYANNSPLRTVYDRVLQREMDRIRL